MKIKIERKAISTLIATVLMILITVAAVSMIWGIVMPMIQKVMQSNQACLNARLSINTQSGHTCFNRTGEEVHVMVSRGTEDFELGGVQIIIGGGGMSKRFEFMAGDRKDNIKIIRETYNQPLEIPMQNEDITYIVKTAIDAETVKVAPTIKVGLSKYNCGISDEAGLDECV